jgi:predicted ATPase/DNA-binding winged helix-turn-helix (wHTH) protein
MFLTGSAVARTPLRALGWHLIIRDKGLDPVVSPGAPTKDVISFGPFSLIASERILTKDGIPVELGARALDTLVVLLSRPNEVVTKRELLGQVWRDVIVDEGSLRFHIASLRKALGDGEEGSRYIATVAGRGYCFVAPISRSRHLDKAAESYSTSFASPALPGRLTRMVGRVEEIREIAARLADFRFVTIVGAGGVGKTTVAVGVAHDLVNTFEGAVAFVDLSTLSDPAVVAPTIASLLGVSTDDAVSSLMAYFRDKRMLLVLDTCEHLIEAVAALTSRIFVAGLQVHLLLTSRESLRVEGEHVYRLEPLACPPEDPEITAASAHTFPAAQLFFERAAASGSRLAFSDADAAIVAGICRKLDGVALAIELAAGRVEAYGLKRTAALLDERLTLRWPGQRTAPPRQKTLQATLEWSYGLLSELERDVLRRLAVFVGQFTLEAALAVVTCPALDEGLVFGAIDSLVAKSMVAARPTGAMMRYRLLEATRAYVLEVRAEAADLADLPVCHARYFQQWLDETAAEWPTLSSAAERASRVADLVEVRAALEWCFAARGDARVGVALAASATRVLWAMSVYGECQRWAERGIAALDDATRGTVEEMHLQAALGMSSMFESRNDATLAALNRSLAIAKALGDARQERQLLAPLHFFHTRNRAFNTALSYATNGVELAKGHGDPTEIALAQTLKGISLHFTGQLGDAREELETVLRRDPVAQANPVFLASGHRIWAGTALARTLWLQGYPDQAMERVLRTIEEATTSGESVSLALHWGSSVLLWAGDIRAKQYVDRYVSRVETFSLGPNLTIGHGIRAALAIHQGDAKYGVEELQRCLEKLHPETYELHTELHLALVQGFIVIGRFAEALRLTDQSVARLEANGDLCYLPELLRLKGKALLSSPKRDDDGEGYYQRSLELSRGQGAMAWELRASIDLAALKADQGRPHDARALLEPVFARFPKGSDTADVRKARDLLATLG